MIVQKEDIFAMRDIAFCAIRVRFIPFERSEMTVFACFDEIKPAFESKLND